MLQTKRFIELSKFFLPCLILIFYSLIQPPQVALASGVVTDCSAYDPIGSNDLASKLVGGGTITFNCGNVGAPATIIVPEITIAAFTSIQGGGVITLSGNVSNRLFRVTGGDLVIDGVNLINGKAPFFNNSYFGGAISVEGSGSNLTIMNSILYNNVAQNTSSSNYSYGGAIYFQPEPISGQLIISNSSLLSNTTNTDGGGAIYLINGHLTINQSTFSRNLVTDNTGDGGAILAFMSPGNSKNVIINNSTFSQNTTGDEGGGLMLATGGSGVINATINNTTIISNTAKGAGGGGIRGRSKNLEGLVNISITNGNISNNQTTSGVGGGVSVQQGALTLNNTQLISNAAQTGGGVNIENSPLTVTTNTNISQNKAQTGAGMGISGGRVTLDNSTISSNVAQLTGGGIELNVTSTINFTATNMTISNNQTVNGNGGGVYAEGSTDSITVYATFMTSTISSNQAGTTGSGNGGGINLKRGTLTLINTTVSNNTAKTSGGGLYLGGDQDLKVTATLMGNSVINNNTASASFGGGIAVKTLTNNSSVNLAITSTTLSNNRSTTSNGGGLGLDMANGSSAKISFDEATISNNQAQLSGGGLFLNRIGYRSTQIILQNNTLVDNNTATSGNGGGIALQSNEAGDMSLSLDKATISNNKAVAGTGGGISILAIGTSKSATTLNNSALSANQATSAGGGGIYHQRTGNSSTGNSSLMVMNSTLDSNLAGSSGGGGLWSAGGGTALANISIVNTTISGNKTQSNGHGGGLQIDKGTAHITHATIYMNTSSNRGGGIRVANAGTAIIQHTILAGNSAVNDALDCDPITTITSNNYNLLGTAKGCPGIFTKPNDLSGGLGTLNPQLAALTLNSPGNTKTHALLANSAAIDAIKPANSSLCPLTSVKNQDQRGNKRPSGLGCDIGAYEFQGPAAFIISKTVTLMPVRGGKFSYTVASLNYGSQTANNVIVTDTLPANVNFSSASDGGTFNSTTREVQWFISSVSDSQTVSRTLTVSSCATTVINNAYRVGGVYQSPLGTPVTSTLVTPTVNLGFKAEPLGLDLTLSDQTTTNGAPITQWLWDFGDNTTGSGPNIHHTYTVGGLKTVKLTVTDSCGYSPPPFIKQIQMGSTGLGVEIVAAPNPVSPTNRMTYTLYITNTGLLSVTNINVTNPLANEVTFVPGSVKAQTNGGLIGTAPPNLAFGLTLTPGQMAIITYNVTVKNALPNNSLITSTASVTSPDLSEAVSSTTSNMVIAFNTLELTSYVNTLTATPGELLTYTLNYTLSGNAPATGVTLQNELPSNLLFVSASLNGTPIGTPSSNRVIWNVGNALANGGSQSGVAKLTVRVATPLPHETLILNTTTITSNENAIPLAAVATSTVKSSHNLQLSKTVEPRLVLGGQRLTYTIFYTISGTAPANGVILVDSVPAQTTYITATNFPDVEPLVGSTGNIIWAIGNVLTANSGITQTTGKVMLVVKANEGLPNNTAILNSAEISSAEQPNATKASARALAANAELAVEKTTSTPSVIAGRIANYTIILRNAGSLTATNVFVRDILPAGFTYSSTLSISQTNATRTATTTPTVGSTTPRWDTWTINPQGEVQISFQTRVDRNVATGSYSNTIERGSQEATYAPLTGLAVVKIDQFPEFSIQKITASPTVLAGGVATYTVVAKNIGTATATGVRLNDVLPKGFTYLATIDTSESGSASHDTTSVPTPNATRPSWGTWTVPINGVFSVTYTVNVSRSVAADIYQNSVTLQANQPIAGEKPIATREIEVKRAPELFINKTTSTPLVIAGETATYTIAVFNLGTAAATRVVVSDILPSGFSYLSSRFETVGATRVLEENPEIGATSLLWRGWTIESGGALTVTFAVHVANKAGDITYNNAGLAASEQTGQVDDDPIFGNDSNTLPNDTANDENITVIHAPSLALEQVGPTLVAAGRIVTYSWIIRNIGSDNAHRVALTEVLPSGFIYHNLVSIQEISAVRNINTNPTPNSSELNWGEWLMGVDGVVTITYLVEIPTSVSEGIYTSNVELNSSNAALVTQQRPVEVSRRPILRISKTALTPIVAKGELATYQILIENEGIISATQVMVTDTLPAGGFAYRDTLNIEENLAERTKLSNPVSSALIPVWSAWTIEPGGSIAITFRADVLRFVEDNNYDNALMVSTDEGVVVENDGTANQSDNVIVGNYPLLSLSKTTTTPEVNAGGIANYVLVVNNSGTATATHVVITDTLPSGFTYLNTLQIEEKLSTRTSSTNPTANTALAVWGAWTIQRYGAVTITFSAKITTTLAQGSYTNTAIASNSEVNQLPDRQPLDKARVSVRPFELSRTYIPIILKQPEQTQTPTPTATSTLMPPTATPTATPTLPSDIIAPDLVVERVVATSKLVQLVIKNQGNAPVTQEFWVDFYVDPNPPPTQINQVWYENGRSKEGIAWGVTASALPINPDDVLVLSYSVEPGASNLYAVAQYSRYSGTMQPGTPVYAQVDSVNIETSYGGVLETHEILGRPYNNISLSTLSTTDVTQFMEIPAPSLPLHPDSLDALPLRP